MLYPNELQALRTRCSKPEPIAQIGHSALVAIPGAMKSSSGRGRGIRTPDPLLPKQVRYQAALCPDKMVDNAGRYERRR